MNIFILTLGVFFTIFSVIVLSYVSIATTLGPWIAPTLVLMASGFARFRLAKNNSIKFQQELLLIQAIGAGGGVIATGIGFSLPILYFLDIETFKSWLLAPRHFCMMISAACLAAGGFGIFLGKIFATTILAKNDLAFPVSQIIYKTATSQTRNNQAKVLFLGVWITLVIGVLRDGFLTFKGFLPRTIYLCKGYLGHAFEFSLSPILWSIGFTSGVGIILPLLVGILSKYLVLYPLNVTFFASFTAEAFTAAFCSGLGIAELVTGLYANVGFLTQRFLAFKAFVIRFCTVHSSQQRALFKKKYSVLVIKNRFIILEFVGVLVGSTLFFSYLNFSFASQLVFLCLVVLATYEISYIGCKVGLIQFGRFSTLVLLPMLLLFKLSFIQITAACVFFNICAATASDLIFDYKTGEFVHLDQHQLYIAQWIGLLVTALSIGFILYLFFTSFTLGSVDFFGHRGRTKALLIQSFNFDYKIVALGLIYGLLLRKIGLSPTMTFGGILMPNNISIGLLVGAFYSYFVKNKEDYIPFCSGIFASESLWIIISAALRLF